MKWRIGISIIVLIVLTLTAVPVVPTVTLAQEGTPVLPEPTGPYQIGTVTYQWVDETPPGREVIFRFWYPAVVDPASTPAPYVHDDTALEGMERSISGSNIDLQGIAHAESNSFAEAPVLSDNEPYPVIVFIHGVDAIPEVYAAYLENLASHGYVVAGGYFRGSDPVRDTIFALDQLAILNTSGSETLFAGHLDLERVGTIGISWGSSPAINIGLHDSRIQAAISLDGGTGRVTSLSQPVMIFKTETQSIDQYTNSAPIYLINIEGFTHVDFSDFTAWPWPEGRENVRVAGYEFGEIDGERTLQIVNDYMLAFFNEYLKGEEQLLLDGPLDEYPEVEFHSRNTD